MLISPPVEVIEQFEQIRSLETDADGHAVVVADQRLLCRHGEVDVLARYFNSVGHDLKFHQRTVGVGENQHAA